MHEKKKRSDKEVRDLMNDYWFSKVEVMPLPQAVNHEDVVKYNQTAEKNTREIKLK